MIFQLSGLGCQFYQTTAPIEIAMSCRSRIRLIKEKRNQLLLDSNHPHKLYKLSEGKTNNLHPEIYLILEIYVY